MPQEPKLPFSEGSWVGIYHRPVTHITHSLLQRIQSSQAFQLDFRLSSGLLFSPLHLFHSYKPSPAPWSQPGSPAPGISAPETLPEWGGGIL